ncbi:RNA polymerase sigma factor [Streptomyces thinghirensis]
MNRRIPRQRDTAGDASPPAEALCPEAQRQWDLLHTMRKSVKQIVYKRTGLPTVARDDIEQRVWLAVYARLKNSGPLDGRFGAAKSYLFAVTRNEAHAYVKELAKLAEDFVGDDAYLLEGKEAYPSPEGELVDLVPLIPAMQVLREELSELQLKAFVLAEAYCMPGPVIAEALGTTHGSVRDALRHARSKLRSERVGLRLGVLAED